MLRAHQDALFRHARTILGDEDAALDATQTGLLLIARRLSTLHDPRWFRAWAYRIVTREAVRAARKRGRERLVIDADVDLQTLDLAAQEPADLWQHCLDAIGLLPPASRIVTQLHYHDGLTLTEIAEALEIPLGTVKSRLAAALAKLRENLAAEERPGWQAVAG